MSQDTVVENSATWPNRMRRREASQYLQDQHGIRLAHATLAKLAVVGGGPRRSGSTADLRFTTATRWMPTRAPGWGHCGEARPMLKAGSRGAAVKRRRPNPRRAKIHRNYDVAEIARLFHVHRNTVRSWLRAGLRAIEGVWPTPILGAEPRRFLTREARQAKAAVFYGTKILCMWCREPRWPALDMADYVPRTPTNGEQSKHLARCAEARWMQCLRPVQRSGPREGGT